MKILQSYPPLSKFLAVGGDGAAQALFERDFALPAERADERGIAELARGAVWLGRIPLDFSVGAGCFFYGVCELLDRYFFTGADIHEIGRVFEIKRKKTCRGKIVHVQKFSERLSRAPKMDLRILCGFEFADKSGQDVAVDDIVVVAGAVEVRGH